MAATPTSLLDGPLFTFTVGAEGEQVEDIVIHSRIVSEHSKQLAALINGPFSEAQIRHARLDDVSVSTFKRFRDFIYMRNYAEPMPGTPTEANSTTMPSRDTNPADYQSAEQQGKENTADEDFWDSLAPRKKQSKKGKGDWSLDFGDGERHSADAMNIRIQKHKAEAKFAALYPKVYAFPASYPPLSWLAPVFEPSHDIWPVLQAHAELYVFAEQRLIPALRSMALQRLHATLHNCALDEKNLDSILKLVSFVFDTNRVSEEIKGKPEPLRQIVTCYLVANIATLGRSAVFASFLGEGGPFVPVFWLCLSETLLSVE